MTSTAGSRPCATGVLFIMTSTIFDERAYDNSIVDAIGTIIDDWGSGTPASTTSNTSTSTAGDRSATPRPSRGTWRRPTSWADRWATATTTAATAPVAARTAA